MGASQCSYYSSLVYESLNRLKRPHCFQSTYDLICWSDDATPGLTPVKDRRKAKQRKPNSSLIAWGCTCSCHGQMCLANIRMQSLLLPILYLKTASPLQIKAQDHLASTSGDWTKVVFRTPSFSAFDCAFIWKHHRLYISSKWCLIPKP